MITSHVRSELDFLRAEGQEGPPKDGFLLQHVAKKLRLNIGGASYYYFIPLVPYSFTWKIVAVPCSSLLVVRMDDFVRLAVS